MADSNSINGTMFLSFPAFQWCKVYLYATDTHGVPFCYESGFYPGAFRPDTGFLHTQLADSNSIIRPMFTSFPAFQRCKVRLSTTDIHGVPFIIRVVSILVPLDSTSDSSTTRPPIPIL